MGHDHHFLSRLDRVNEAEVELALGLYRDASLVRLIIGYHDNWIPKSAPRVAMAMNDSGNGPFIIVARDGHFVTVLGEGMTVGHGTPLITREQLDRCATSLDVLREMQRTQSKKQQITEMRRLIVKLTKNASSITREDMRAFVMLSPIIDSMINTTRYRSIQQIGDLWGRVGTINKPHAGDGVLLETWWECMWSIGVTTMLTSLRDRRALDYVPEEIRHGLAWHGVAQAVMPTALRALWGAGKAGEAIASYCQNALDGPLGTSPTLITAMGTLLTSALRYPHLEGMAREILRPERVMAHHGEGYRMLRSLPKALRQSIAVLDDPEGADRDFVDRGRQVAAGRAAWGGFQAQDVPDHLARLAALHWYTEYMVDETGFLHLLKASPWLARANPEDLFAPASHVAAVSETFSVTRALEILRPLYTVMQGQIVPEMPKPVPAKPNEPCPCGSGKKFKKCCGSVR